MTPLVRIALFYASALLAGAIGWVALEVSLWLALIVVGFGGLIALVSTIELRPPAAAEEPEEPEEPAADFKIRQADRGDIARRAAASRET